MSTSKKKKPTASTPLPLKSTQAPLVAQIEKVTDNLDDEPKVSFTLEFYAVEEQPSSFVGRLKKVGSEEQVSLIEDLDAGKIVAFLQRNLPKAWQEKAETKPNTAAPKLERAIGTNLEQALPIPSGTMPSIQLGRSGVTTKDAIEVWQNGQALQTIRAELPATIFFKAGEQKRWARVDAHFKSLEAHNPDQHFSKHNIVAEKIAVELSSGQLRPGIYSLSLSAESEKEAEPNPAQVSANQLVQVI
jgi:hypothetical protein